MSAAQSAAGKPAAGHPVKRHRSATVLRKLAIPIVLFWVLAAAVTNIFVPTIEKNTAENAEAMVPRDAPSSQAAIEQGRAFDESDYTSAGVILLESHGRKLDDGDHTYYNELVRRLLADHEHVQSVIDLWGKPTTMSGAQSADGEAATLTIRPTGDLGDAASNHSIEAIRDIVAQLPKPDGLSVYVSGPAPLASDTLGAADESMVTLTVVTVIIIITMLLIAYRSVTRAVIPLMGVLVTLATTRGVVSFLVGRHLIGISSFAMNMVVGLVLGVATDYGIFYLGRYHEARRSGMSREDAYYDSVSNTSHVILGSGVAISGATLCLSLTKLNYFRTLGPPCFVAMIVAVAAALTLGPALLTLGSKIKYLETPRPTSRTWRRLGTVIARWPVPVMAIAALVMPLCIANLATYKVSYNDRDFAPASVESVRGYAAADRHFPTSQLSTDVLFLQADHDMRNTTDMIGLDRVAKAIFRTPGISMVQGITRPNGRPLEHASLPFAMGSMGTKIGQNLVFLKDRVADMDAMAADMGQTIAATHEMEEATSRMQTGTKLTYEASQRLRNITDTARDQMANVDDFIRPLRNYTYWEPHCFDIPICWAIRNAHDLSDSIDKFDEEIAAMTNGLGVIDTVTPQMITALHGMAESMGKMQSVTLALQSTMNSFVPQLESMINPMIDMAQAFDNAKNDDFFFLPPDAFKTEEFQTGMKILMTPDGHGARFMVFHKGEAMSPQGIKQVKAAAANAAEAIKGTSLSEAKLMWAGAASNYVDVQYFSFNDLAIMMLATFGLVFVIVLVITRALIGSIIVLITVVASFAGSLGLASFIWETLFGIELHWLTIPIAFIVLVGVGCDYNLLLLSRYREELRHGIGTGMVRAMAGSGNVVVTAAFVLAGTMLAMLSSDVVNIGQAGSTICIGLIFDMMIVRLFLVMPLARLLGPWFWWPSVPRPTAHTAPPSPAEPVRPAGPTDPNDPVTEPQPALV